MGNITAFLRMQQGSIERMKDRISTGEAPRFEVAFADLAALCPEARGEKDVLRYLWLNSRMRRELGKLKDLRGCQRREFINALLATWKEEKGKGNKFDSDVSQGLKALEKEKCPH